MTVSKTTSYRPHITPTPDRLRGKVSIVTGGARGIGRAIAERFASEGANVVIGDKDEDEARRTANACGGVALRTDVASRSDVDRLIDFAVREFGAIHILVNNAGIIVFDSLMDCRIEDWDRMLAVDLTGAFHCTQAAGRKMAEQGAGGRLIHIGSTASILPTPAQAAYAIAKAGLLMMSRMAAMELASYEITSNLICPEGAVTDINRELLSDPAVMNKLESKIPMGRLATVEEIAATAAFLASDEAAYITGTELIHDGGILQSALWWR